MTDRSSNWPKSSPSCHRLEINLRKIVWLVAMLGVLGSVISGCSPFYVIRAAYEEGKILWRREPIPEYLEKPELGADTQDKLKLVLAVREYARDVLKLNVGGSYSSYSYVDRPDLTYILTAAPRTELRPYTWWFLIVGRVPYKGYFSKEDAATAAKELESEGYDTNIRTSAAFSTLGWFDDPLLAHLLRYAGRRSWSFRHLSKGLQHRSTSSIRKRFPKKTNFVFAKESSIGLKRNGRSGSPSIRRTGSVILPNSRSTMRSSFTIGFTLRISNCSRRCTRPKAKISFAPSIRFERRWRRAASRLRLFKVC